MEAKCKRCGRGDMLVPDPAGYYCDAEIPEGLQAGAPLACQWCHDANHPAVVEARKHLRARKMIVITMPDHSKWAVAAEVVAHDRANYYRSDGYREEFEYAMNDPGELLDWAANNMNWEEVRVFARPYQQPEEMGQDGFQEGWVNGPKKVTDVPIHLDLPIPECK